VWFKNACPDGSAIYATLKDNGFNHGPHVILGSKAPAHEPLPGVHRIAALFKRWFLGTHQGAVDPRHVDYYLDEFQPTKVWLKRNAFLPTDSAIRCCSTCYIRRHSRQSSPNQNCTRTFKNCGVKWIALMHAQHFPGTFPNSTPTKKPHKPTWRVILGRAAWSRHTYERPEGDELRLIGSVSKGPQVGALAMTAAGEYVQVVGDHVTPLKTKEIAKAVANAPKEFNLGAARFSRDVPWQAARRDAPVPVVVVKKRRVVPARAGWG
jgi:hypothetical protein